jgi:hypothetical protein
MNLSRVRARAREAGGAAVLRRSACGHLAGYGPYPVV